MCIALAAYGNRIASVFESSEKFVIVEAPFYDLNKSRSVKIDNNSPDALLRLLRNNKVTVLICGAISGYVRHLLEAQNIQIIPWVTGAIPEIIQAFRSDNLISPDFIMPGCGGRGRHGRHQFKRGRSHF